MGLNLYDLLDVEESASSDEVRAAWKASIADLDPTDRRFRAFNDAAGVLLDPEKRAAYDRELSTQRDVEDGSVEETAVAEAPADAPVVEEAPAVEQVSEDAEPETVVVADEAAVAEPDRVEDDDVPEEEQGSATAVPADPSRGPGLWILGTAAVAAILAVVLAVWVLAQPDVKAKADDAARLTSADATVEQLVAQKIVPALSYDYRSLGQNLKDVQQYMTPTMAGREQKSWGALSKQAKQQHAVVTSSSPMTGLTRISSDGSKAVVVAFIDQRVRKLGTAAFTLKMWATFVLEKNTTTGSWLVDDICTDRVCG